MTATRRLRVLVVQPAGVLGGAEQWLLDLLAATDRLDVEVVALADGPAVAALRERARRVTVLPTGRRAVDGLRPAAALRRLLRSDPPEVLLANGVKAAALALPVAALVGVPAVWVKHDRSYDARLSGPLARLAARVVLTDASVGQALPDRARTVVLPPPAPPAPLPRAEARAVLGLVDGAAPAGPLAVQVGRLVDYKGADDAVAALARPQARAWTLLVIGEDDPAAPGERARLTDLSRRLGVQDRVRFAGHVPQAGRLVSAADALLVLTKPVPGGGPGVEGFGTSALEAARAGVPVVAVAGSPPAQRLVPGAGLAVPVGDPDALADALAALADEQARAQLGAEARRRSADHPAAAEVADRLAAVLAEVAGRPGAGRAGPPATVVVTVRDEQEAVPALLERLLPQLRPQDELVVVDGGSSDATVPLLRAAAAGRAGLRVLVEPGAGISRGRNLGIAAARGEVVACTDAGCEPVPGWLGELVAGFAEPEPPALVTGVYRVTARPGRRWEQALAAVGYPDPVEARRPTPGVRAYGRLLGRTFDPTLPTGRSMAFRPDAWRAAGGFPEHLATGEDVSYGRAVVAAGGRAVLATGAEVAWAQRETLRANLRMYRAYGHGDGLTGSRLLVGRNLARAAAYPAGLLLLGRGGAPGRVLALLGAAGYLSLPLQRAARTAPGALPLVPVLAALRDGAKALGCLEGLRAARRP